MSIKEESHTLREWQKILANNPELMAEFEEMTPPTPIKGDISEQPVSDHHEIEVEFRGEKVTISREFYRNGERNYSTSEQDDNAIWAALRAWCEKKGITPFGLYPKQSEQPVEGLEEAARHSEILTYPMPEDGDIEKVMKVQEARIFHEIGFKAGVEWMKSKYEK